MINLHFISAPLTCSVILQGANFICQVLGAFWYLFSIESKHRCWRNACDNNGCELYNLYCGNASCLLESNETKSPADFDFGIFLDALQSHVVDRKDFSKKFFYCFWWGLRNLRFVILLMFLYA